MSKFKKYSNKTNSSTKAVIFARVSSVDQQDNNSLDAQIHKLKSYCERKGFEIIKEIKLVESSTRGERKQFYEMIDFIRKQKDQVHLIVDAVDRLQRSFKEVPVLEELRLAGKITLHFLREVQVLDKKSSSTQLMAYQMFVMMANSFTNAISDNVKRGFGEKRRNGEVLGHVPIGYLNKEKEVIVDEARSPLVKKLFEDYATGLYSCQDLATKYGKLGLTNIKSGKFLSNSQVDRMVTHPFYYGMIEDFDEDENHILRPHKYPNLISKSLFDECQDVKYGRGHNRYKRTLEDYTFTGLVKCEICNCSYSSYKQKGRYVYLRPVNKRNIECNHITSIAEANILPQVESAIAKLNIPEAVASSIKQEIEKDLKDEEKRNMSVVENLKKEREKIKQSIQGWNLICANDLRITAEERNETLDPLKTRLNELEERIEQESSLLNEDFKMITSSLLGLASKALLLFKSSHPAQKREFLNLICANLKLKGENLLISYAKPFDLFAKYDEFQEWSG